MTPLKRLTNLTMWVSFRRMLGLFVFFYASLHLLTYVGIDYRFSWKPILMMFLKKNIFLLVCCMGFINSISNNFFTKNDQIT
jgi:sulfoxide reductase heme-binding subunit YedZ